MKLLNKIKNIITYLWRIRIIVIIKEELTPEKIIFLVGAFHGFPKNWHKNKTRIPQYALRRFEAMVIIREKLEFISKENIPIYFNLSRASLYHAEKQVNSLLDTDKNYKQKYNKLLKFIERNQ